MLRHDLALELTLDLGKSSRSRGIARLVTLDDGAERLCIGRRKNRTGVDQSTRQELIRVARIEVVDSPDVSVDYGQEKEIQREGGR